jgi:hypothetical protein
MEADRSASSSLSQRVLTKRKTFLFACAYVYASGFSLSLSLAGSSGSERMRVDVGGNSQPLATSSGVASMYIGESGRFIACPDAPSVFEDTEHARYSTKHTERHRDQRRVGGGKWVAGRNLVVGLGLGNVDALRVPDGRRAVGEAALEGLERSLWRFRSGRVCAALPLGVCVPSVVTLRDGAEEK